MKIMVSSCLIGGIPKTKTVNVRFVIWLIVYATVCSANDGGTYDFSIVSDYRTSSDVEFVITVGGSAQKKSPFSEQTLAEILHLFTDSCEITEKGNLVYHPVFSVGRIGS